MSAQTGARLRHDLHIAAGCCTEDGTVNDALHAVMVRRINRLVRHERSQMRNPSRKELARRRLRTLDLM